MHIDPQISVRPQDAASDKHAVRSEVVIAGRPSGKFVSGKLLEVALVDEQLDVLDAATIGGPYSTGTFASLVLEAPDAVSFRFAGDTTWRIELLERPAFRMPFLSEPRGVWRAPGFSRHFIVRGSPQPQDD